MAQDERMTQRSNDNATYKAPQNTSHDPTPQALIERTARNLDFNGNSTQPYQAEQFNAENHSPANESDESDLEDLRSERAIEEVREMDHGLDSVDNDRIYNDRPVNEIFRCESCYAVEIPQNPGPPIFWPDPHFCSDRCREQYAIGRIKKLGVGQRFLHATFDNFQINDHNRRAYEMTRAGAHDLERGLFIYGSVGAGKTHLMIAMIREMLGNNVATPSEILFMPILDLLERVKMSWETGQRSPIEALKRIPVLFIDDLGMEVVKDWAFQIFLNIVTYRYNEDLPLYVSSNLTEGELLDRYGSAVFSRLAQMCQIVKLDAPNHRMERHEPG